MLSDFDMQRDLAGLESAEDFLTHFGIEFSPDVVAASRLHILQRFHDYLEQHARVSALSLAACRDCLARAYSDFVRSDAITEKVFRVHRRAAGISIVPLSSIGKGARK